MPNVLVRDLPPEVHAALQRRAELQGQSLQQYLLGELTRLVEKPTMAEWIARVESRRGGTSHMSEDVVKVIHEEREKRDAHIAELAFPKKPKGGGKQ